MDTLLTLVAMETVHHDYRPTFVHFYKMSMFNDDVAFDSNYCDIFTKPCMSKVKYEALPGVLEIQGEGLLIFRDLGRRVIYFQSITFFGF